MRNPGCNFVRAQTLMVWIATVFIAICVSVPNAAKAQRTPRANAVKMNDSLVVPASISSGNYSAVVFHPVQLKFYSFRSGNMGFPLLTWDAFKNFIYADTAGIDSRGMWYNPLTAQVERNCFSSLGWTTVELDGSGNATHNYSTLFTGMLQPNSQSVAAFDYNTNKVLFYYMSNLYVYDRNTGLLDGTIPLTGVSLASVNTTTVIYTGEANYEIGLLDYTGKRILLFNRFTGAYTGASQLPSTTVTSSVYRFSYAWNRVWLFNAAAAVKIWFSYNIWNEPIPLPVELLKFSAEPGNKHVVCEWSTASELNNDYFTVERSKNGVDFESLGIVSGAGTSSNRSDYRFVDQNPQYGVSYYRIKQTDYDGTSTHSRSVAVKMIAAGISVFPTIVSESFSINGNFQQSGQQVIFQLRDVTGRILMTRAFEANESGQLTEDIPCTNLSSGIYYVVLKTSEGDSKPFRLVVR